MATSSPSAGLEGFQLSSLQALQSAGQMELLDVVDSLRAEGLGEITALPQLIVCGDQSSGKSSVLEAISGIPFPRKENLCTRFATEVVLRRSPNTKFSVSIIPSQDRAPAEKEQLKKFRYELGTQDDLSNLFEQATKIILSNQTHSFSKDILSIELHGPTQPQLTLVDLPGLIHSNIESAKGDDVKLVSDLVNNYLNNPRSIILAVVSAKYDSGNQAILERARKVDPDRSRTLGIITKPDTLEMGSEAEAEFLKIARNEKVKFRLGWHVLRNVDTSKQDDKKELPSDRDRLEELYLKESNFRSLPSYSVRILPLRARLSKILFHQIRFELPRLIEEIRSRIATCETARDMLGPSRVEVDEQRGFLLQLSQKFQSICQSATRGDYSHEFFQSDEIAERRLCANLMNKHLEFAKTLEKDGCLWRIGENNNDEDFRSRTRESAIEEACKLLKRSRGRELPGLPNPLLVGELFREYSRPWKDHARNHVKIIWDITNGFLELLLMYLTDEDAREKILCLWLNPIMTQKLETAYTKLDELLEVHKEHPLTTNYQFLDNREKIRQESNDVRMEEMVKAEFAKTTNQKVTVDEILRIMSKSNAQAIKDSDMIAAEDAFDNMRAYYKVALNLFVDNVPNLAIQAPIVRKLDEMFCPTAVFNMDVDLVTKLAGESEEKIIERDKILSSLNSLYAGVKICGQYAVRLQHFDPRQNQQQPELGTRDAARVETQTSTQAEVKQTSKAESDNSFTTTIRGGKDGQEDKQVEVKPAASLGNPFSNYPGNISEVPLGKPTPRGAQSVLQSSSSAPSSNQPFRFPTTLAVPTSSSASTPPASYTSASNMFAGVAKQTPEAKSSAGGIGGPLPSSSDSTKGGFSGFGVPPSSSLDSTKSAWGFGVIPPSSSNLTKGGFSGFGVPPSSSSDSTKRASGFGEISSSPFAIDPTKTTNQAFGSFSTAKSPFAGVFSPKPSESQQIPKTNLTLSEIVAGIPRTRLIPSFIPVTIPDPNRFVEKNTFQTICMLSDFKELSHEEVRLADYADQK